MTIPPRGKTWSANEGNYLLRDHGIRRYMDYLKAEDVKQAEEFCRSG